MKDSGNIKDLSIVLSIKFEVDKFDEERNFLSNRNLWASLATVRAREFLALFRPIADFACLDGRGFSEDGRAKFMEAIVLAVEPLPFGRTESMEEGNGGATVTGEVRGIYNMSHGIGKKE